ncbi:hypothetical protein [Gulosibacter molinativorax]|uniref:Growth/differentiation factor n=1 Tax=Gulosibacter molinativorax TaxID=256821 RepID=A0ABT7CCB5_9MICO|nr:hypothetical protein [Gulosibacter molinativorax]MDJ1372449.1 hypothetical protein [Gulosibacter molinativorax]QUY63502.1 Hypotetical protein [Gulosibacter molinativorax]
MFVELVSADVTAGILALAQHTSTIAQSSSSSSNNEGLLYLLLLGPASGFFFYGAMMRRYRNHDKRFHYEHDSSSEMVNVQEYDRRVSRITGTRARRIQGDNSRDPLQRLGSRTKVYRRQ